MNFLALGDSYTIGEQVPLHQNFPYQFVQMLRKDGINIAAPEICAQTGWTTDELLQQIKKTSFLEKYSLVTLLIGVNNQYRGREIPNYQSELDELLQLAINFSGKQHGNVYVISIPDWGVTPFAEGRDRNGIAGQIDKYNSACKLITESRHCNFINITDEQRLHGSKPEFLANDKLHPSAMEYEKWAAQLFKAVRSKSLPGD